MRFLCVLLVLFTSACSTYVPADKNNLCSIFKGNKDWYDSAVSVYKERGVPINTIMAFINQESSYIHDAKPPMRWFLFIPYGRGSSSYGYSQAQDPVWDDYKKETDRIFVSRDDFEDSLDFISWYMLKTTKINKVPLSNVYLQYLNYHEGWGGYKRGSYNNNSALKSVAKKVERQSNLYKQQLKDCRL